MKIERIKELVKQLNIYRDEYYNNSNSLVSDYEYDKLFDELAALEKETGFVLVNSPTQTVGYETLNSLKKVTHNHPMLSLAKTKSWSEFCRYFDPYDCTVMLKLDGLTCSLEYKNGELISAETRGNGEIGEDIFHTIKTVKTVPQKIPYKGNLIVDGEIICTYDDFAPFAEEYKNPRNFASGSIRLLDAEECAKRNLTFVAWNVVSGIDEEDRFIGKIEKISSFGFTVVPWTSSPDFDAKDFLVNKAKELGYPIDGLVGRFDNIKYGESLGATAHHANAAFAFKFYDEEVETRLRYIEWTMGKTGVLTPTAVFDPVEIEGTTVERASLHNISIMLQTLGDPPWVGEEIKVFKANAIIPQVVQEPRAFEDIPEFGVFFAIPDVCPICGGATRQVTENGTAILECTNPGCKGKLLGKFSYFASKKAMDIDGLSEATIEFLISKGWINKFSDLYHLAQYEAEWAKAPGFGAKSVKKILASIEESREVDFTHFLTALSIEGIGSSASKTISECFNGDFDSFVSAALGGYDFTTIEGIGSTGHANIQNFIHSYADAITNLMKEVHFKAVTKKTTTEGASLNGKAFCITGSLVQFANRDALVADIEAHGGKFVSGVSSKCNYLINNDVNSTSSKNKKAKDLGIPIITEEDYINMSK